MVRRLHSMPVSELSLAKRLRRRLNHLFFGAEVKLSRWRRKKPVIGLVGFFGWGNYGDELFVDVWRQFLEPHFEVRVLPDMQAKPYYSRGIARAVAKVDAIVIGGGDLVVPWSFSDLYWHKHYLTKPVFIGGVGVPRWGNNVEWIVRGMREFFQHPSVKYIYARDPQSRAWIEQHLQPTATLTDAPDLVCALDLPAAVKPVQPVFGYTTRYLDPERYPDRDADYEHIHIAARRMQELGYKVRHVILGVDAVGLRDREDAKRMLLPDEELVYSQDISVLSRAIGECTVFASMKFHGTVVATMYAVPSVVIMPTTKSRNFLIRIDREDLMSHYSSAQMPHIVAALPAPIAPESVETLRQQSTAELLRIRDAIATELGVTISH
ncbi:MAG: polysaccharide pyruvyl transferase family protein [Actinobacteria bacterium]|nr:polysaccharide pyruvyl transferase family protein [Actinomycetota bacterium]